MTQSTRKGGHLTPNGLYMAQYPKRLDVLSVVHNHGMNVIPFGVTKTPIKPILHMCASMGWDVHAWDSRDRFDDTNLLVRTLDMGYDLAESLGNERAALMRGHGCVVVAESLKLAVFASVYLEMNAGIQLKSHLLGGEDVTFLSEGEVEQIIGTRTSFAIELAWERWARRANRSHDREPNKADFSYICVQATRWRRVVSLHNTVVRLINRMSG